MENWVTTSFKHVGIPEFVGICISYMYRSIQVHDDRWDDRISRCLLEGLEGTYRRIKPISHNLGGVIVILQGGVLVFP